MLQTFENHLLATNRSAGTVRQRLLHITHLRHEFPDLLAVTLDDLERVLARMRFTHKAETRKSVRSSFMVFYRWAYRTGLVAENPAAELGSISIPVSVPRLAPDDVVQMALISATLSEQVAIMLARMACLRLTELSTLPFAARRGDELRILGKGEKERIVHINDALMPILLKQEAELGNSTRFYLPGRFGGSQHPQSTNKIITRVTGYNPHSLRHAGATAAYRATGNLRAVQEMLGHASMATTQRYLHLNQDERRAAAAGTAFIDPVRSPHFPSSPTRYSVVGAESKAA